MSQQLEVRLVKSLIGATKTQIAVLTSLGLKKIGDVVKQPNNAATNGKLNKISHMIKIN